MALPAHTRTLRLAIVAVALFGVLLVLHLSMQAANDFAFGCSGVVGGEAAAESGCADVTQSEWGTVLGVPQVTLGFLFYFLMAGLRLAYAVRRSDALRLAAFVLSGVGVAYSAFLVFIQATQIGSFCALCLGSALTTLVLFVLHMMEHRRLRTVADAPVRTARPEPTGVRALRPYVPILGVFVLLLGAEMVLARTNAERAAAEAGPTPNIASVASGNAASASAAAGGEGACTYDPAIAPIADTSPFTTGPFRGNADATVEIVEIFDPNCPHCKDLMAMLEPVIEANLDRVRFYPVAYPLRQQSIGQVAALTLAQREGKYFELIEEMFRRQDSSWGMTMPEIEAAVGAVGMSPALVSGFFADEARMQPLLEGIQAQAASVGRAFATADGGISVPKVAVNGRVLAATHASYSPACVQQFIDEAAGAPAE